MASKLRAAAILLAAGALAHQFHYSTVEADWNTRGRTLEVTARLHADDIEAHISRQAGRRIELDRDRAAEALVCAYTTAHLEFARTPLRCLGMEVTANFVTVYLEGALPANTPPPTARHRIMSDEFPDQINTLILRQNGHPAGRPITFLSRDAAKPLAWPPAPKP